MPTEEGKLNINDWREIMIAKDMAEKANEKIDNLVRALSEQNKPTNGELALMISNLSQTIEVGFKGVHDRQDKTNGRIGKVEERTGKLENWRWYLIGGGSVVLFGITILLRFI